MFRQALDISTLASMPIVSYNRSQPCKLFVKVVGFSSLNASDGSLKYSYLFFVISIAIHLKLGPVGLIGHFSFSILIIIFIALCVGYTV